MKRKSIVSLRFEKMGVELPGSDGGSTKKIFDNVTMALPMNKIVWLRGQSGGGKSVLVRILNGLIPLTRGSYFVNGEDASHMDFEDFKPYRLNTGYAFDYGGLINNRTIESNLLLPLEYHSAGTLAENKKQVQFYLDYFGLKDVMNERPAAIVGGLKKAACVARAFVGEPEMLLLDDPTTGLRVGTIEQLRDLLRTKMAEGQLKHVFVASEDERLFRGLDHAIIEVRDGSLFLAGAHEGAA